MQATPVPGSVILNVGDLTEFWTSGIFPATVRVCVNFELGKKANLRYRINDGIISTAPSSDHTRRT